ncbi:AdoMet_MTases domain containing protein [Candidatus Pelagibacterales bacterium]
MLNISYPKSYQQKEISSYCLDENISQRTIIGNLNSNTGPELRLQEIYGDEIWLKLQRAGFSPEKLNSLNILEPCAGTGFLSYHLLKRFTPKSYIANEISSLEIEQAIRLLSNYEFSKIINWNNDDIFKFNLNQNIDLIIGNSFLHHFHNVGKVLTKFANLLNKGGTFISLHEPSEIADIVESGILYRYPFAVMYPELINDIIRYKYKGKINNTDIWMFNKKKISELALNSGFSKVNIYSWNLVRQIYVAKNSLHLNEIKPMLLDHEVKGLKRAIYLDSYLNKFLPSRFFGSLMVVFVK